MRYVESARVPRNLGTILLMLEGAVDILDVV
jgi:hypothetical protein